MIVAGCDVGSLTAKAVILNQRSILGTAVVKSKVDPAESAREVMNRALMEAGVPSDSIEYCVGTVSYTHLRAHET